MNLINPKKLYLLQFISCLTALSTAYYFEYFEEISPCVLCLIERYLIFILSGLFLIVLLLCKTEKAQKRGQIVAFIICLLGFIISARHVWLQLQPPRETKTCLAGLESLLDQNIWLQAAQALLSQHNYCGIVEIRLFWLSLAQWTNLFFLALCALTLYAVFLLRGHKKSGHKTRFYNH